MKLGASALYTLADVPDEYNRLPKERLSSQKGKGGYMRKSKLTKPRKVDESNQDDWFHRVRKDLYCSLSCDGFKCKVESWEAMKSSEQRNVAIEGLNSNWVGDNVIASQRPSTSLFLKYPIIKEFRTKHVTGVVNLQEKGEHQRCGPDGVYESSGYSYNGVEDLMPHGISYYEFPWPDMTAPQQDIVLRSVQVMDFHVRKKGRLLVHCHAGLGRTGLMIACYYMYSQHLSSVDAIEKVRRCRPGAIQTKRQALFIADFEKHLWRLSQAFRVEISDALIDLELFMLRQRQVLHGKQAELYRHVPMFLHHILCRLLFLTRDHTENAICTLQSVGSSFTSDAATMASYRIAINQRQFFIHQVNDVSILSFLVCDWFRSMFAPVLSVKDCDRFVEFQCEGLNAQDSMHTVIRQIISKPKRHTIGMVISAFFIISERVANDALKKYAFRCIVDSFNHAFHSIKVRHSPTERELLQSFFLNWGRSVGDMYFNYNAVPSTHRTIKRIALASRAVMLANLGDSAPSSAVFE